jgi:hypothetical protein
VALLLKRKTEKTLTEWTPFGPRLLKARFQSKYTKLTLLICYAPTNYTHAEVKDTFCDQFQAAMECIRAHDMVLILGDFNAKVGCKNTGREHGMGKHGIGTINNNGQKLVENPSC